MHTCTHSHSSQHQKLQFSSLFRSLLSFDSCIGTIFLLVLVCLCVCVSVLDRQLSCLLSLLSSSSSSFHVSIRVDRTQYCYSHYSCNIFRTVETVNLYRRIFLVDLVIFASFFFLGVLCNSTSFRDIWIAVHLVLDVIVFVSLNVKLMCEFLVL